MSATAEDCLQWVWKRSEGNRLASTSSLAQRVGVAAGTMSAMLGRLADQGFLEHVAYHGARLTPEGTGEATRLIRRHRVLELFLEQVLGYTWGVVHIEADWLGHELSCLLQVRPIEDTPGKRDDDGRSEV